MELRKKLNEATWTELATFTYDGRSAWLYGLNTTTGLLFFVEHEDKNHELKQDYLKFGDLEGAKKAYWNCSAKLLRGE